MTVLGVGANVRAIHSSKNWESKNLSRRSVFPTSVDCPLLSAVVALPLGASPSFPVLGPPPPRSGMRLNSAYSCLAVIPDARIVPYELHSRFRYRLSVLARACSAVQTNPNAALLCLDPSGYPDRGAKPCLLEAQCYCLNQPACRVQLLDFSATWADRWKKCLCPEEAQEVFALE